MNERECTICHKMFLPTHFNQKRCKGPHFRYCLECGKPMPWTEYDRCCSAQCTDKKRRKTCLEKFGNEIPNRTEIVLSKCRATCRKNYGVDYPAQSKEIKLKQAASFNSHFGKETNPEGFAELDKRRKLTCLAKYGTEYSFQSENNRSKSKATCLERYGTATPMQTSACKNKLKQSMMTKYGVDNCMKVPEFRQKVKDACLAKYGVPYSAQSEQVKNKIRETNMKRYGVPWYCMTQKCKDASGKIISKLNKQFSQFLNDNEIAHEMEYRIGTCSFDFKIGDKLIEIDPSFTHTCAYNPFDKEYPGLSQDYHINKTRLAQENGFRCIHIFDWDDWSKLLPLLSPSTDVIYARKCYAKFISAQEATIFLDSYHLEGVCDLKDTVRIGLTDNSGIVAIMVLKRGRLSYSNHWELLRLCSKGSYHVIGGASKMFRLFLRKYHPNSVVASCDLAKFTGSVYLKLGFSIIRQDEPAKIWWKDGNRISDTLLQQYGYNYCLDVDDDFELPEELMLRQHWFPLYDCGRLTFEWRMK